MCGLTTRAARNCTGLGGGLTTVCCEVGHPLARTPLCPTQVRVRETLILAVDLPGTSWQAGRYLDASIALWECRVGSAPRCRAVSTTTCWLKSTEAQSLAELTT